MIHEESELELDEKKEEPELLANIRRLTVRVLDDLEEGSRNRTLDQQQKRLLSSTGVRLLRLWRLVEKERESKKPRGTVGKEVEGSVESKSLETGDQRV